MTKSPAARLRRVSRRLSASGDADDAWVAAAIEAVLADPTGATRLDRRLGLAPGRGRRKWTSIEAAERRDEALRAFRAMLPCETLEEIGKCIDRYSTTVWPRDRAAKAMPAKYAGEPAQRLYEAFLAAGTLGVPISPKHLRRIFREGHEMPSFRVPAEPRSCEQPLKGLPHVDSAASL